jgi:hypothetical protein
VSGEPCKRIIRRDGETAARGKGKGLVFEGRIEADLEEMVEGATGESVGESGGDHPFMSTASKCLRTLRLATIQMLEVSGPNL